MTETFESIKKRKMKNLGPEPEIPNGEPNIEYKDLLELLKIHATEINRMLKKYHATMDNSGHCPQLIISEK